MIISVASGLTREPGHYILYAMGRIWQQQGHQVHWGPAYRADADLCALHVDRTCLSPEELPPAPHGVPVLNGQILDISKRRFSGLEVRPDTDWDGEVIVKTNLNHFGLPEREQDGQGAGWLARWRGRLAEKSWNLARQLPHRRYPVLRSWRVVPAWVWRDPDYIVERFLPERVDGLFALRGWMFFGAASYSWRLFSLDPMVKIETKVRFEYLDEPPESLRQLKVRAGFDFGKFDYVMHDGEPIVLDLNKTPSLGMFNGDSPNIRRLADGLKAFMS